VVAQHAPRKKILRRNLFSLSLIALGGCAPPPQFQPISEEEETLIYVVQPGDILPIVALQHGEDYRDLAQWNRLEPPYLLSPGQKLRLTPPANFLPETTSIGGELSPPANSPKKEIPPSNNLSRETENHFKWQWPTNGKILRGFSPDNQGIDIGGQKGNPIYAAAAGKVVYSGTGIIGYGPLIIVKHNDTYLSAYAHNNKILVQEGDYVTQGQKIAEMGVNQRQNPLLHFEIRRNGKSVDPLKYLASR